MLSKLLISDEIRLSGSDVKFVPAEAGDQTLLVA
jgi:hypothetical protein